MKSGSSIETAGDVRDYAAKSRPVAFSSLILSLASNSLRCRHQQQHEAAGERFLAPFFGEDVLQPVRLHVSAKRYLCATDKDYWNGTPPACFCAPYAPDRRNHQPRVDGSRLVEILGVSCHHIVMCASVYV